MIRYDGSGSPWRRCSFTKSTSAREAAAFPGEERNAADGGALCDGHRTVVPVEVVVVSKKTMTLKNLKTTT